MNLRRRDFLAALGALGLSQFFPRLARAERGRFQRVLVAGGGVSGLYAADLLRRLGYQVTVLEAGARAGGKLLGGNVGGHWLDLGGQGFGREMNRVARLGKSLGLKRVRLPRTEPFFLRDHGLMTGAPCEALIRERERFNDRVGELFSALGDVNRRREWSAISVMKFAEAHFSELGRDYFRSNFAAEWCALPEDVSFLHFLEVERAFEGTEATEMEFRFREGFAALAARLSDRLGDHLHLNSPVEEVRLHENAVDVLAGGRKFTASHLVLAIPPPALSRVRFAGFDASPLLAALRAFRGGEVRKVVLVYEKRFWAGRACDGVYSRPCGFGLMDNSDLSAKIYSLAVFLGGPAARAGLTQEQVLERLAEVLGAQALHPRAYHEEAWLDSAYLSGGYAANRGPSEGDPVSLPESVGGRIFLAGSETASHFPSYVEGALAAAEKAVSGLVSESERRNLQSMVRF